MGLVDLAPTTVVLEALRHAYADAVRLTLILALASACIAFPASWAMEWLNIKHIAEKRRQTQDLPVLGNQEQEKFDGIAASDSIKEGNGTRVAVVVDGAASD